MGNIKSSDYKSHSFGAEYEVVKATTLQMSDFANGNNKYYQLEHHKDKQNRHRLYSRYGRTGKQGVEEERMADDEYMAQSEFDRIIRSKNKKGYVEVKMVSAAMGSEKAKTKILSEDFKKDGITTKATKSGVVYAAEIVKLVSRLFNEAGQTCQASLNGSLQTSARNPLGTLTLSQIKEGEDIIKEVNKLLSRRKDLIGTVDPEVIELSNKFYSAIPHEIPLRPRDQAGREEWMKKYLLNSATILDEKDDLLKLLTDVKGMLEGFESDDFGVKYNEINCEFNPVDNDVFKKVKDFMENTQSRHHNWKLRVRNVYAVSSKAQKPYSDYMKPIGNIQPLFHGSRPANIMGICKKGLLLRPPGAYVTGSMFGNGLYFADQSTKSSQYATARYGGSGSAHGDTYFMFVADVALGKIKKYEDAQMQLVKAPPGYDSVQGVKGSALVHNEFITYDIRQNQLQYLIEFETI